jgi:hypothetical protein
MRQREFALVGGSELLKEEGRHEGGVRVEVSEAEILRFAEGEVVSEELGFVPWCEHGDDAALEWRCSEEREELNYEAHPTVIEERERHNETFGSFFLS